MPAVNDLFRSAGLIFVSVFPFWPFVLVPASLRRTRNVLGAALLLWLLFLGGRLLTRAASAQPAGFGIPEPLNTYLFLAAGALLIGAFLAARTLRHRQHVAADRARYSVDLLKISPAEFDEMVVELYQKQGAKARRIAGKGDHAVNVVVDTPKGEKWVIRCRQLRGWVGEAEVREFYGTLEQHNAQKGVLITTGTFITPARAWAKDKPLVLVDGTEFIKIWRESKKH